MRTARRCCVATRSAELFPGGLAVASENQRLHGSGDLRVFRPGTHGWNGGTGRRPATHRAASHRVASRCAASRCAVWPRASHAVRTVAVRRACALIRITGYGFRNVYWIQTRRDDRLFLQGETLRPPIGRPPRAASTRARRSQGTMTIQVERAHGLEALGIVRSGRVHWNLSPAALYEEALRRGEAQLAAEGPLVARTGQHTGRSPNDKFVVREPQSEQHVHWGAVNKPIDEAKFDALHRDMMAYAAGQGSVRARRVGRHRPEVPAADPRRQRVRLAQPVRAEHVSAGERSGEARRRIVRNTPSSTFRKFKADPGASRHALRGLHPRALRPQAGADWRHALRRRDQEVDLHDPELHAAAPGRACRCTARRTSATTATRRCSSVSPAPARPRSRAIRAAG